MCFRACGGLICWGDVLVAALFWEAKPTCAADVVSSEGAFVCFRAAICYDLVGYTRARWRNLPMVPHAVHWSDKSVFSSVIFLDERVTTMG